MAAVRGDSREKLLDAAEELFASRGFNGTSTRDIAAQSGNTLGTLSYHFRNKDDLYLEVVRRRFDELMEERRQHIRQARAESPDGQLTLDAVIAAVVVPFARRGLGQEECWRRYIVLLGRMMHVVNRRHQQALSTLIDPVAREALDWFREAEPEADDMALAHAYQFMVGCMLDACCSGRHERMRRVTNDSYPCDDFDEVCPRLLRFVSAGMRELLTPGR